MPWNDRTAPNVMLDVTDACNASCRACYHPRGAGMKSLAQVTIDLDAAARLRDIHTVTISGGEPTLHPRLCEIVRQIKVRGYHCFLLTNGVLTDRPMLRDLAKAGLDSILFHVDPGQEREDLPDAPDLAAVQRRLSTLARASDLCGIEPSASFTVYPDRQSDVHPIIEFFFQSPELTFLFLSKAVNPVSFTPLCLSSAGDPRSDTPRGQGALSAARMVEAMENRYGWSPFSFIPSTFTGEGSPAPFLWVSYFLPVVFRDGKLAAQYRFRPTALDRQLIQVPRLLTGRHVHKTRQQPLVTLARVVANGLARGRIGSVCAYIRSALARRAKIRHKMIVYDDGPFLRDGGELVHCEYCPTAIVREGRLQPCCTLQQKFEAG